MFVSFAFFLFPLQTAESHRPRLPLGRSRRRAKAFALLRVFVVPKKHKNKKKLKKNIRKRMKKGLKMGRKYLITCFFLLFGSFCFDVFLLVSGVQIGAICSSTEKAFRRGVVLRVPFCAHVCQVPMKVRPKKNFHKGRGTAVSCSWGGLCMIK